MKMHVTEAKETGKCDVFVNDAKQGQTKARYLPYCRYIQTNANMEKINGYRMKLIVLKMATRITIFINLI